jgi:hypothetical protein
MPRVLTNRDGTLAAALEASLLRWGGLGSSRSSSLNMGTEPVAVRAEHVLAVNQPEPSQERGMAVEPCPSIDSPTSPHGLALRAYMSFWWFQGLQPCVVGGCQLRVRPMQTMDSHCWRRSCHRAMVNHHSAKRAYVACILGSQG